MKKQIVSAVLGGMLSIATLNGYAVSITPVTPVIAGGDPVVAAINRATQAVQQISQQTADKLTPNFTALQKSIESVQQNQTQVWNQFVKMQADSQFTPGADGEDHSSYQLIHDSGYAPTRQVIAADAADDAWLLPSWKKIRQSQAGSVPCSNEETQFGKSSFNCELDQGVYPYQDELGFVSEVQYQHPDTMLALSQGLLTKIGAGGLNPLSAAIPFAVITDIFASRNPGKDGAPSMMASLQTAVESALSPAREQGIANASALDVARAQLHETALTNYLLYQNMQLQQQQLAMMAAMMAQNGARK